MPKPGKPFITLNRVTLDLCGQALFPNTTWEIAEAQLWAVTGLNGSGKSTLLKAIQGHVPLVAGRIRYHFLKNSHPPGHKTDRKVDCKYGGGRPQNRIAYVSFDAQKANMQRERLFHQARFNSFLEEAGLSVSACLSQGYIKKINPYQVRTQDPENNSDPEAFAALRREVVQSLEIEHLMDRKMIQLSNGERRKIMLAAALLKRPALLILDNPFSGLDEGFRTKLQTLIQTIADGETQVIISTCRREDIPAGVTHLLLVEGHRVTAQGPIARVLKKPASANLPNNATAVAEMDFGAVPPAPKSYPDCRQLIRLKNVRIAYGDKVILEDINWVVDRGQHWALLGPNGSGKTTLLSLILGDNPQAYANDIHLFGRQRGSGESIWDIKQRIGWVATELHLYYPKHFRCFDVVCSGFFDSVGLFRKVSTKQQAIARWWLQAFNIEQRADARFGALSEGEQRMLLLVRALVKNPQLLILDEPCQGLDEANRNRFLALVEAIGSRLNTTIIYVTHHRDEIPAMFQHVLRLACGRIEG